MNEVPLFSYRVGKSFIHRLPALVKIFLLFILPALIFLVPQSWTAVFIVLFACLACLAGFTLFQQLQDIKPVLWYCVFLGLVQLFSFFTGQGFSSGEFLNITLKLIASMQCASLFFKTTTSLDLRGALEKLLGSRFSVLFALFLAFIPLLFSVWFYLERSWKARGGKNNIKKIYILLPVFILTALHKAEQVFYSLQNRS